MTVTLALTLLVVLGLLCLSALFSSSETAIFALPQEWIDEAASTDDRARTLGHLREDPHRLLVTILVGNNVVNIAMTSLTTAVLVETLPPGVAIPVTTLVISVVVLVFGEIVPKSYGFGNARSWSLRVAGPITAVERVLWPIVTAFDLVTRVISRAIGGDPTMEERFLDE